MGGKVKGRKGVGGVGESERSKRTIKRTAMIDGELRDVEWTKKQRTLEMQREGDILMERNKKVSKQSGNINR